MIYAKNVEGEYVLVVEPDLMLLATTHSILSDAGYEVASCSTPEEAIAICEEHRRARVALSKVIFPGSPLTGIHVAHSARRACGVVTVLTDHHDQALLYGIKAFDRYPFLPQPYTPQQVLGAVAEAWWSGSRRSGGEDIPPDEEPSPDSGYRNGADCMLPVIRAAYLRAGIGSPRAPRVPAGGVHGLPCYN
jgi:DNA-binding NtrC family response regulator